MSSYNDSDIRLGRQFQLQAAPHNVWHGASYSHSVVQGSYRILSVVFQTFPVQNYFFFHPFRGTLFIFMWTKNITKLAFKRWNFLYNVFFYSKYQMGLKFLNSELQMLCVMNCKKITNASVINSVTDIFIFQVNITVFKVFFPDFSIPMIIFKTFQGLENFYIKFQDFPYFSRICTNPGREWRRPPREPSSRWIDRLRKTNKNNKSFF